MSESAEAKQNKILPDCIGYYGKPIHTFGPCMRCGCSNACIRLIAKERLQPLLDLVVDTRKVLKQG